MEKFEATTRGVRVIVHPAYVAERSNPAAGHYFFAYHVRIENHGEQTVQLDSRHWIITDAHDRVEEVDGPGVVGEQPVLAPGAAFEYTSVCPLPTPFGSMEGIYRMVTPDGETFAASIPRFTLAQPLAVN